MRVQPNQNAGIPASAPESETKITDGTSNTIVFAESSKAKTPFANDSFETSTPVKATKDQARGQFMDYTDDSCISKRPVKSQVKN